MDSRVILVFVILVVLVLYVTTYIRIPQTGYPAPIYLNNIKEIDQEQDDSKFHGETLTVVTAVKTLKQINNRCQKVSNNSYWKTLEPSGEVWYSGNLNLYYCIVPKVGCTYWKRVLRFISQDFPKNENIKSPTDIKRKFVHAGEHPHIQEFKISNTAIQRNMTKRSFMFVRNPYARLWSAYLDKLFLPDNYRVRAKMARFLRPNKTEEELECDSDVSFQEFLTYITEMWPKPFNLHWEPIHLLCRPCHVNYAAIGKMENFEEDAKYIMAKFGINSIWNNTALKQNLAYEEIKSLTVYNFKIVLPNVQCFNKTELAQRLWKTFQYNGYIDRFTEFPVTAFIGVNTKDQAISTFLEVAKRTINLQPKDISSQKHSMMLDTYRQIPSELLTAIKDIHKYDFELFEYEKDVFK